MARKYGTSVAAICRLNSGLTAKSTLRIGKSIRVR
ncbi:MAG: LysM peptidoglycan-binding domain-containing protein [Bacteroidales bacterium]|nr:LysM peptidoglycan-binding domain-containing protein [Bacteroidales bacterium]